MPNPYPTEFLTVLDTIDGRVLDCGGAGRTHPRIVTLDLEHHPDNDVRADALALPFPAESFALVLSQAVVEHVTDPQLYIDEITRVLAPGGVLFIEGAFMQPVHQAPHHYFNVTEYGLRHLCRALDVQWVAGIGTLAETWDWVGGEAGAHDVLDVDEFTMVRDALTRVDAVMTHARHMVVASGVRLVATKP